MHLTFAEMRRRLQATGARRLAVAGGADPELLTSLAQASKLGLIIPVVVGDGKEIRQAADAAQIDLATFELHAEPDPDKVALCAAGLVRAGKCEILMKGTTATGLFMKGVLDRESGLRRADAGLISHVFVTTSRRLGRTFCIVDAGININPTLAEKAQIIRNTLPLAQALGADRPLVAVLAAVEKPNPQMPETMDALALVEMNKRGELGPCVVAGPLALDNIVSEDAARKKDIAGPVAGKADIILVPNIVTGNSVCKAIIYFAGDSSGGYVAGASAPVIFLSRADDVETRLNSITLGVLMAGIKK